MNFSSSFFRRASDIQLGTFLTNLIEKFLNLMPDHE
jgi:hypothetical protein